ncbi:MAG: FadR/GntR family transcriptional regulator [Bilophila wadsworthia]
MTASWTPIHLCLAECSGNRLLINTVALLNEQYAGSRTADLRDASWHQFSVASHLRIIDALERQSAEGCRKAVEEHLDTIVHKHLSSQQGTSKILPSPPSACGNRC